MHKAIFLDRDGTLNPDPGYISNPDDFNLYEGVAEALSRLQQAGFLLILITNQSGIARGLITPEQLGSIHAKMQAQLARAGARIDAIYHCPHHPDFPYKDGLAECDCRKPQPGMVLRAIKEHDIDPATSYVVGDRSSDIKIGLKTGITPILIGPQPMSGFEQVATFSSLGAAADWILSR